MNCKIIVNLVLALLFSSCTVTLKKEDITPIVSTEMTVVTPVKDGASGIVYALPKTGLRFVVTAQKIEKKRGDFYLYSERYLGLKDVILEDAVEWEIKSVALEPFGVANSGELFQIVSSEKSASPFIQLSEDGVILSINSDISRDKKEEIGDVVKPVVKQAAPYTEEMLLANSSAKMAQEAANYIYRLRESRTALLSADLAVLPPDGEAYAMSLDKIDILEDQFLSLFKGTETVSCVTKVIDIIPDEVKDKDILFRFSSFNGVVAVDDFSGSPVFITMEKGDFTPLKNTPGDTLGVYYKRPAPVTIKVYDGSTEILSEKILMGQFGELQTLAPHLLNDEVKIQFYPTTGAIKAILK